MIRLQVLGPVDLTVGGEPAPAPLLWRKHLALLVYLALAGDRAHGRDALVTLLWPDKDTGSGRHSLNEAVRVLRRAAGDDVVESAGDRLKLHLSRIELDTTALLAAAARGDAARAAALVRGPPFDGFGVAGATSYEDWLAAERMTWRSRSVDALLSAADAALRAGRAVDAADLARRALAISPDADAAARQAMRALALADDRGAALELFTRFRQRLADDFGAAPETATLELAGRLGGGSGARRLGGSAAGVLGGSAARRPGGREGAGAQRRGALAGREQELGAMVRLWVEARQEHAARAVLLLGDAGAGRSRLAEELIARAELDGAGIALARAVPSDRAQAGGGLLALARSGLAHMPGVAAAATSAHAVLGAAVPEWREQFPGAPGVSGDERDGTIAAAVTEIIRAASDDQPVLVVLDDAHWMDEDSLGAVIALLRDLASHPLLVVITAPTHAASPALDALRARIGRDTPGVTLRLEPLDAGALREIAVAWLPHFGAAQLDRVVRRVSADSAGVALLAAELFRAIAQGLDLGEDAEPASWPAPDRTLDQTLPSPIPDTLSAAIRLGCARLPDDARQVLLAAAAGPERVTSDALVKAIAIPADRVVAALDTLEWARWIVSDARGYTFRARVVRDIVRRELLTPGQRRRMAEAMSIEGA